MHVRFLWLNMTVVGKIWMTRLTWRDVSLDLTSITVHCLLLCLGWWPVNEIRSSLIHFVSTESCSFIWCATETKYHELLHKTRLSIWKTKDKAMAIVSNVLLQSGWYGLTDVSRRNAGPSLITCQDLLWTEQKRENLEGKSPHDWRTNKVEDQCLLCYSFANVNKIKRTQEHIYISYE